MHLPFNHKKGQVSNVVYEAVKLRWVKRERSELVVMQIRVSSNQNSNYEVVLLLLWCLQSDYLNSAHSDRS